MDGYSPGLRAAKTYLEARIGGGQGWLDMNVHSYQGAELVVAMGVDLTYHHEAALVFKEPFFFSGPFSWTAPSTGARALHRLTATELDETPVYYYRSKNPTRDEP